MKKNRARPPSARRRAATEATLAAAAALRAGRDADAEAKPPAKARRKPAAPATGKPKPAPRRRASRAAKPDQPDRKARKPAPRGKAKGAAGRQVAPRRRAPAAPPSPNEPYAVRVARRGGVPEPRPLERSGAMAFPFAGHLDPPSFLDDIAAAEWRRISALQGRFAERGLSWISEVDLAAVTAYCAGWSIWCRAARALMAEVDFVAEGEKGRRPIPELRIEREARASLLALAKELGLASMVRARIQAQMYSGSGADDGDGLLA